MKKFFLLVLVFVFIGQACDESLEVSPRSDKSVIPQSLEDAQIALNGCYVFLRSPYLKGGFASMGYAILETPTGTLMPAAGTQDVGMEQAYELSFLDTNGNAFLLWEAYYSGIEQANIVITYVPEIQDEALTDDLSSQLLAEAHFLRAYYYFQLVQIFGDIPLNLTPTSTLEDGQIGKSSIQEVYEQVIVPDLEIAENAGLPDFSSDGRVSSGVVKALLAKVYLTMAGNPLNQSDKYALASGKAKEVMDAGDYSLFQTDPGPDSLTWMDKLSDPTFDLREENMFMAQFETGQIISTISTYFTPLGGTDITDLTLHFGGMEPEPSFLASYDPSDVRGQNRGFFFNELDGFTFNWSVYKYFYEAFRTENGISNKNVSLIRYADVLLTFAEAQNEADGTANSEAYAALNAIRNRAGLASVIGLSQNDFREEVWKQRVWEFPAENGLIWFDMKRTLKAFNGAGFNDFVGHTLPNGAVLNADHINWPIPANEVLLNPSLAD